MAPFWSWVSVPCGVEFIDIVWGWTSGFRPILEILFTPDITVSGRDPFGVVKIGSMTLSGRRLLVEIADASLTRLPLPLPEGKAWTTRYFLDDPDQPPPKDILLLVLGIETMRSRNNETYKVFYLGVEGTQGSTDTYRRVGFAESSIVMPAPNKQPSGLLVALEDLETSTIRLV